MQQNGEIILSDGRKVKLTDGRVVTFAGELREAPRNIELPKPIGAPGGTRATAPEHGLGPAASVVLPIRGWDRGEESEERENGGSER